ncbi:hypothetical protein [Heyndrickxia sporothermodurans]
MAGESVRFSWGPFMSSCYISIMEGQNYGPMLHISGEKSDSAARLLTGLSRLDEETDYPIEDIRKFLPSKDCIEWQDELKGDHFLGYEIRGKGPNFKIWMTAKDVKADLSDNEKADLLSHLKEVISTFFP